MTIKTYRNALNPSTTPQSRPVPGREAEMVRNAAGGYVFQLDDWNLLDRFLILGTEGGTYYANERDHTVLATDALMRLTADDANGARLVQRIVEVSARGRAIRNTAAIVALAYVSKKAPGVETRRMAYKSLPTVARTGTDLFAWAEMIQTFGGWSRGARRAVDEWYKSLPDDRLGYQLVKYRQRNGWTHRDMLRLAHATPRPLLGWAAGKPSDEAWLAPPVVVGFEHAQAAMTAKETARLIREYRLPREAVKPEHLHDPAVWEALLQDMPVFALIRNLGNLTKAGVIAPLSDGTKRTLELLGSPTRIQKSRVHPFAILLALRTYAQGHGDRGKGRWTPVQPVIDALNAAFYTAFGNVEPTNKRIVVAIDTSGSMSGWQPYGGDGSMSTAELAAAMALVVVKTEPNVHVVGFDTDTRPLNISGAQRIDDVMRITRKYTGGATDFASVFAYAEREGIHADAFVSYTDGETWCGWRHPFQAMRHYRQTMVSDARMVNAAMTATNTRLSDETDPLALECIGLDAALPQAIASFIGGM